MTKNKYTDVCLKIIEAANMKIPLAFQTRLKTDRQATADKPGRQTLKFCIWGKSKNGFWNRHYSSYHIVYDSNQELHQKGVLQVRFMFFLNREETSAGRHNQEVKKVLSRLAGKRKFTFVLNDEVAFLYRPYFKFNTETQKAVATDLGWLISQTFPHFDKLK